MTSFICQLCGKSEDRCIELKFPDDKYVCVDCSHKQPTCRHNQQVSNRTWLCKEEPLKQKKEWSDSFLLEIIFFY